MVKILGIGDLIITALLSASAFNVSIPLDMLIFISAVFFLKGVVFLLDVKSVFNIIAF